MHNIFSAAAKHSGVQERARSFARKQCKSKKEFIVNHRKVTGKEQIIGGYHNVFIAVVIVSCFHKRVVIYTPGMTTSFSLFSLVSQH